MFSAFMTVTSCYFFRWRKVSRCAPSMIIYTKYRSNRALFYSQCLTLFFHHSHKQREGMGLLEYQAMPSLCDVGHVGWLCNVYIYFITAAENSISSQLGSSCQGSRYGIVKAGGTSRPSRTKSHLPGHSPHPVSQAGRRIGPAL